MKRATIHVEPLVLPTYPDPPKEEMPLFAECRDHQRTTGRPYPNKATLSVDRTHREEKDYTAVRLENDWLEVIVLPEIGGKIFSARNKMTGYDFFYRQHVIKPGLIGAFGSWTSGGVEFNWPFHHRASAFLPCDYEIEACADGSVVCWLSEHEPTDRMKGMVGVALRPDAAYLETRVRLCNRTESTKSFLWWENAAVPVNENYETAVLMDQLGAAPEEKLDLLLPRLPAMRRDDLFVELARAYNQAHQPEKARAVLMNHVFTACEGGEHAIADQYMFSFFQEGARQEKAGDYEAALESYTQALTLPASLGAGIWNRTKYVPYRCRIAECLDRLGRRAEAEEIWREMLEIDIDFFSNMHLPELPYYQALAAEKLGLQQRAWNLMGAAKRNWTRELKRTDSGFFRTTPFFISFVQSASELREAQYDYLLALVSLYEGEKRRAAELFERSSRLNADHLFCRYYRDALADEGC